MLREALGALGMRGKVRRLALVQHVATQTIEHENDDAAHSAAPFNQSGYSAAREPSDAVI